MVIPPLAKKSRDFFSEQPVSARTTRISVVLKILFMLLIWWPLIFPVAVLFGNLIGKPGWIEQPPEEQDSAALATTDQIDERPVRAKGRRGGNFSAHRCCRHREPGDGGSLSGDN